MAGVKTLQDVLPRVQDRQDLRSQAWTCLKGYFFSRPKESSFTKRCVCPACQVHSPLLGPGRAWNNLWLPLSVPALPGISLPCPLSSSTKGQAA